MDWSNASSKHATCWARIAPELVDRSPRSPTVETAFTAIGDMESARLARLIRDHIFKTYVRPEAVQPPLERPDPVIEP